MLTVLQAFGKEEGFGGAEDGKPNRPTRNNNPLDLTYCSETIHFGASGGDPRFAVFPDIDTGWNAGRRWLSVPAKFDGSGDLVGGYLGATLKQVVFRFAPPNENNSQAYLDGVCASTGLTPETVLTSELLS